MGLMALFQKWMRLFKWLKDVEIDLKDQEARDSYVLQECNCDAWLTNRNGLMKLVQGFQDVWSISFKKVRMALKGLDGRIGL